MKIRTEEDIQQLALKIEQELGIDVRKYQNEEVIDSISSLITFPIYALQWIIRPPFIAIFIWVIGFFFIDLVHVEYLLYFILGLVLFVINGALTGVLVLTNKLQTDLIGIMEHSLGILKSAIGDLQRTGKLMTKEARARNFALLFKGIVHVVTIPTLSRIISNKVPFVGGILKGLVRRILTLAADRFRYHDKQIDAIVQQEEGPSKVIEVYEQAISGSITGIRKLIVFARKAVQLPFKLVFIITFSILLLFLYLIW